MGIGRSFQEALQKACQSLEIGRNGLGADGKEITDQNQILESLEFPSWNRLFHIYDAIKLGIPFKRIQEKTKIDEWFLRQIEDLIKLERKIEKFSLDSIPKEMLFEAKQKGYADRQVAHLLRCLESEIYAKREAFGIQRVYKMVDTCAGEFPAQTPYYYSTFELDNELNSITHAYMVYWLPKKHVMKLSRSIVILKPFQQTSILQISCTLNLYSGNTFMTLFVMKNQKV